jgi:hypothetical protein
MRTIRRMILILGCIGFITLYVAQNGVALAATPLVVLIGVLAGLAVAKWLPWGWYGRQFAAGVRGGIVACGLAAAGVLLSLVGTGPHSVAALAARSHLPGIDLTPVVMSLGAPSWFMPYLLLTTFFAVGGILVAGVVAQVFGWSKNVHTVRIINQAHNAAAGIHRSQTWAPTSNSTPSLGSYLNSAAPSFGPASHPGLVVSGIGVTAAQQAITHAPVSGGRRVRARGMSDAPFEQQPAYLAPLPPMPFDFDESAASEPLPPIPPMSAPPAPPRRTNSGVQAVSASMTEELRRALDRWDGEVEPTNEMAEPTETSPTKKTASKAKVPAKRQPKASAYLNSEPPATPRRNRKKQDTRDWLC